TSLSTSAAFAGRYDPVWLDGRDRDGVTLRDALVAFGGDPSAVDTVRREPGRVLGYLAVHIEQGPQLEAAGQPLGIVTAISGIYRARVRVTGEAGHAGTVPMALRRDAYAAAAAMTRAIERAGAARPDTVATVGTATIRPGAINVIPAQVDFT